MRRKRVRRKKDPCEGEREKPKINNGVRVRLDLRTENGQFFNLLDLLSICPNLRGS